MVRPFRISLLAGAGLLAIAAALTAGCTAPAAVPQPGAPAGAAASVAGPRATDWRWLDRTGFGADQAALARLHAIGRARYLDEQLRMPPADPPALAATIAALPMTQQSAEQGYRAMRAEQQRINTLATDDQKQEARNALNRVGADALQQTAQRHLLRALYSPAQLRERMTWFWMNHFSVYGSKGALRWTLAEHEERAVRPHALGRFRDLLMATVTSPAMLDYLDNAQSASGKINENYARELMELHTLGVAGGPSGSRYTQQDVQELARILTGVGINATGQPPRLNPQRQALYRVDGLFEFNPNRHDFEPKTLLGRRIEPSGFAEVEQAVDILAREPATARFISAKLAQYFVADAPPPALVARMAATFQQTDGDIAAVLRTMFLAPEMEASLVAGQGKFKDPMQFVVSSLRLAHGGRPVDNLRPVLGWLNQLGEPLYGRVTPDGFPLAESAWTSSGQMVRRFEIARAIGTGQAGLFTGQDGKPLRTPPAFAEGAFRETLGSALGPATREALGRAASPPEWNTVLLSSPEWMMQ